MERLSLDTSVSTIELVTPPGQVSAASALSAALRSPQETEADRIRKQLYENFIDSLRKLTDLASVGSKDIDEDNSQLNELVHSLEKVILHGFIGEEMDYGAIERDDCAIKCRSLSPTLDSRSTTGLVKKSIFKPKTPWNFIDESLRKQASNNPAFMDLLNTVTAMGGKTTLTLWIKLGLMQSSLGDALCLISSSDQNATLLLQYYEPYALIRHEDAITPISQMISGLSLLEFNFCLKPSPTKREFVKTASSASFSSSSSSSSSSHHTTGPTSVFKDMASALSSKIDNITASTSSRKHIDETAEEATPSKISTKSLPPPTQETVHLQSLVTELEKSNAMLLDETRRLERKLSQTQQERDDLKMELEASSRRQLELSAQLDRARLMARTVKQELDKRRGMEKQNSVSSASST